MLNFMQFLILWTTTGTVGRRIGSRRPLRRSRRRIDISTSYSVISIRLILFIYLFKDYMFVNSFVKTGEIDVSQIPIRHFWEYGFLTFYIWTMDVIERIFF